MRANQCAESGPHLSANLESKLAPFLREAQKKCGTHASFNSAEGETGAARNDPPPVRRSVDFRTERRRPEGPPRRAGRRYNGIEPYFARLNIAEGECCCGAEGSADQPGSTLDWPPNDRIGKRVRPSDSAADASHPYLGGGPMLRKILGMSALTRFMLVVALGAGWQVRAQDVKTAYPNMAPIDQYLMESDAEIALARSGAMESVSRDAEVMVLGRHGYETAVKGKNGFVCMVERSWTAESDDPDFWNPKIRSAICFNPAAARTYLPLTIKKTELVLSGRSKTQMLESMKIAFDRKELPPIESGAMCYMLGKQSYLNDRDVHWHPHVMIFVPLTEPETWGANLPGSPVFGAGSRRGSAYDISNSGRQVV